MPAVVWGSKPIAASNPPGTPPRLLPPGEASPLPPAFLLHSGPPHVPRPPHPARAACAKKRARLIRRVPTPTLIQTWSSTLAVRSSAEPRPLRSAARTMSQNSSKLVKTRQIMSRAVKSKSSQVRSGQVKSSQVRSGQVRSMQVRSGKQNPDEGRLWSAVLGEV